MKSIALDLYILHLMFWKLDDLNIVRTISWFPFLKFLFIAHNNPSFSEVCSLSFNSNILIFCPSPLKWIVIIVCYGLAALWRSEKESLTFQPITNVSRNKYVCLFFFKQIYFVKAVRCEQLEISRKCALEKLLVVCSHNFSFDILLISDV